MSNNKYIQLCYDERIVIENRLKNGESYTALTKSLGRSTSTIPREVNSKSNVATITYDNGAEFSSWRATEKTLAVDIYFADPYKSSVVRVLS